MTTSQELAEWALKLSWSDLPANVQQIVKEHALDVVAFEHPEIAVVHAAHVTGALAGNVP